MKEHRKIVWLASYPKSGNTWVRCFLDAYFLGEVDINDMVCSVADDNASRHQIGDGSDIRELPIEIQLLARPMALLRLVRMFLANKHAKVPLFVKTHVPHVVANGVELLPEALTYSVIHIVRNPLDVLPSFSKHMGCEPDKGLEYMCDKYRTIYAPDMNKTADFMGSWDDYVKSYMNADTHNVFTIKYEDLLADPVLYFSKILKHSGVEPDIERVKQAIEIVKLDKLRKQEEEKGFHESSEHAKDQFFGKGGKSGRKKLPEFIKFRVERKFGRIMKRLGYLSKSKRAA